MPTLHFEIKRVTATGLAFNPPKGSDALHEALKIDYPHLDSLQKRMQQAVLDFLLAESIIQQQLADQATQQYLSTPPSTQTTPPAYLTSPESSFVAYTPPSENVSPKQGSVNTTAQQGMMDVWSLPTATQTKQHKRRCMTSGEKEQYRLKRLQGACADCKRRRRKCHHNSSSSSQADSHASPALPHVSGKSDRRTSKTPSRHVISKSEIHTSKPALETDALASIDLGAFEIPDWAMPEAAAEPIEPFAWDMPIDQDWTLFSGVASPSSQSTDDVVPATQPYSHAFSTFDTQPSHPTGQPSQTTHSSESLAISQPTQDAFYEDWFIDSSMSGTAPYGKDAIHRTHLNTRLDHSSSSCGNSSCQEGMHDLAAYAKSLQRLHQQAAQQWQHSHANVQPTNILTTSQHSVQSSTAAECSYSTHENVNPQSIATAWLLARPAVQLSAQMCSSSRLAAQPSVSQLLAQTSRLLSEASTGRLSSSPDSQDMPSREVNVSSNACGSQNVPIQKDVPGRDTNGNAEPAPGCSAWGLQVIPLRNSMLGRSAGGTGDTLGVPGHTQGSTIAHHLSSLLDKLDNHTPAPSEILRQPRSQQDWNDLALSELSWMEQEVSESSRLLSQGFPAGTLQRSSPSCKQLATQRENVDTRTLATMSGTSAWVWAAATELLRGSFLSAIMFAFIGLQLFGWSLGSISIIALVAFASTYGSEKGAKTKTCSSDIVQSQGSRFAGHLRGFAGTRSAMLRVC